ncbi:MAG: hypothetical protein RL596_1269 [Bacteroidota bacterium]
MITSTANWKKTFLVPIVLGVLVFSASCNSSESAAKIITQKAKEQTKKLALSKVVDVSACIEQIETMVVEPSFSGHIAEKTELISSW